MLSKNMLKKLNKKESVKVRYIGKKYASWWGSEPYEATPWATNAGGWLNMRWRLEDPDGDYYPVADGTLMDGLEKDWEIVLNEEESK